MEDLRSLPRAEATKLRPGSAHCSAYVGPPAEYDFMGATQFRLLTALGLRETHRLLDFGCGSLRAGRLFLPYLLPGHYFGIEPNRWLIDDAILGELGQGFIDLRRPTFSDRSDFRIDGFGVTFDYIIAQSIFSHAGRDLVARALTSFRENLADYGLVLATFIHENTMGHGEEFAGDGWVYPGCVTYRPETILSMAREAGLHALLLPWFHARQFWYVMARSLADLPPRQKFSHLSGGVLNDKRFTQST